jgi:hypothetical protein
LHLHSSGLLWSCTSIWRVFPFAIVVGNRELEKGFFSKAFEEHGFSSSLISYMISWLVVFFIF